MKQPKNKIMASMIINMPMGVSSKDKAQFIKPLEAPVKAKICANVAEPKIIKNDITVMRNAPSLP